MRCILATWVQIGPICQSCDSIDSTSLFRGFPRKAQMLFFCSRMAGYFRDRTGGTETRENGRPGFEALHGIILEPEEWTAELGLTTPTLKLKRPALRSKYSFRLKALYDSLEQQNN